MYRCVALCARRQGLDPGDSRRLAECAAGVQIQFVPQDQTQRVLLNGEDVTAAIREPGISELASVVSQVPGVRTAMVALQRNLARSGPVVMEGRDIGTV